MPLNLLLEAMICPYCGADRLETDRRPLGCACCGVEIRVSENTVLLTASEDIDSPEWKEKQAAAVAEYLDESYNADDTVPRLFGGFMAVTLGRDDTVLDIGCGIGADFPPYVKELGLHAYLGLEPLLMQVDRPFACLAGAVAESIPLKDDSLDAAIFATSQDHIVDIDAAMAEVRRVVKPGGRLYMWIGLYEPEMLAWQKSFHNITHRGSLARRIVRSAALPAEYALLLWRMYDQARRRRKGLPLDEFHERWYTRASVTESLERWGTPADRTLLVPGTPSLFIEARNP